jgi:competence protein ComEC
VLASRPTDGWLLWLVPAAWLLTRNPNNLFDVSFQLSFGAVAGLLLLARPLTRLFRFLPGALAQMVGITTAASLSTAPISMLTFGSASLVSVPANVAGGFVLGPIMFVGMLSLLLGFVGSWLSTPLNVVAGLFIGFLMEVSRLFGRLPFAVYEWRGVSLRLLLLVAFCGELAVVAGLARRAGGGLAAYVRDPRRRMALMAATAGLAVAVLLLAPMPAAPPRQPTLTFLNVGEGAATLFQAPGGPTVLVDAGPAPLARTLRAHAVQRIDLLVLSHAHADHTAGLSDIVGSIPITTALLPRPPAPSAALEALAARLTAAGAEVRWCEAPAELAGAGWSLRVLPTSAPAGESGNQSENDAALVVLADLGGRRALVPGDAEGEVLDGLDLPECAVVELPHHGSRGGLDEAQLDALAPALAIISVGPNTYGHPTPEMLALLAAGGVACARTDQRGEIALTAAPRGLEVRVSRGG